MKKLKKVLSLVLVLAMVFSFASTAFAVDTGYNDNDEIQNTEAVAVMSGMGVINGKEDNRFDPSGRFLRSEAAKIMTYIMLGPDTAEALTASTDPFPDVPANEWYGPSVAYVTNKGLVCGWDGGFHPQEPLTREQWLKMLLGTLGYDTSKLQGNNWEVATQAAAVKAGIVTSEELKLDFNRDTAVLYAWNALWAPLAGKTATYVITVDGVEHKYTELSEAVVELIDTLVDSKLCAKITLDSVNTLGEDVFDLAFVYTADAYGRPQTAYSYNSGNKITKITHTPVATYNVETKGEDILKDLGVRGPEASVAVVWEDGQRIDTNTEISKLYSYGGQGVALEIYENPFKGTVLGEAIDAIFDVENDYWVVAINTYAYEVEPDDVAKYAPKDIVLPMGGTVPAANYELGDVIAYTVGKNVFPAQVDAKVIDGTPGTVTTQNTTHEVVRINRGDVTYVNVNATKAVNDDAMKFNTDLSVGKSYTFYYDSYGNILYLGQAPEIINDVAFVLEVETLFNPAKSHLITPEKDKYVSAMLVLTLDGQVKLLDRAITEEPGKEPKFTNLTGVCADADSYVKKNVGYNGNVNQFREIGEVEGGYAICHYPHNQSITLTAGSAEATLGTDSVYVTNKTNVTVFTYDRMSKTVVKTDKYTGYDNFPKGVTTLDKAYVVRRGDVVTDIYAVEWAGPVVEDVWAVYSHEGSNIEGEQGYMFYIDGTLTRVVLDKSYTKGDFNKDWAYKLHLVDGKVTDWDRDLLVADDIVTKNEADYIVVNGTVYYVDADTVIMDANQNFGSVGTETLATNIDKVAVAASIKGGKLTAELIYVYPHP